MSLLAASVLPTGQALFKGKDTGLIFYPSLPQKLQGTKQVDRPDFDITWPYDWPRWMQNLHSEHATIEVAYHKSFNPVVADLSAARRTQFIGEMQGTPDKKAEREAERLKKLLGEPLRIVWWMGTVHDGIWCGDDNTLWMGGRWRDGIVLGGHFFNCDWVTGEKRGGTFHSGIWHGGLHRGGEFKGLWLTGVWAGGEFDGFRERTKIPPGLVTGNACIY